MLVLPQKAVKVRWHVKNKDWYESKGYKFTKFNDFIYVNVLHLIPSSKEYIELICDYCFTPYKKQYTDYLKWKEKSPIKKDCCKKYA